MLSYYAHLGARVLCGRSSLLGLCALLCPPPLDWLDWNMIVLLWERALKHLEGKYKKKYFCVYPHCVIKHFRVNSAPGSQHDNDDGSHRGSFFFFLFLFVCLFFFKCNR